jgi:hypothetical protein
MDDGVPGPAEAEDDDAVAAVHPGYPVAHALSGLANLVLARVAGRSELSNSKAPRHRIVLPSHGPRQSARHLPGQDADHPPQ